MPPLPTADTVLDVDALRTFTTGMTLGSFARAAARLGRSPSAVSAHLRKLEAQVGAPLVRKAGRGLAPTAAGEVLLAYARRLLDLHAETLAAVRGAESGGQVRLGVQEDFGDTLLPDVLTRFARLNPGARVEARVARHAELVERVTAGTLDLALVWEDSERGLDDGDRLHVVRVAELPMVWVGPRRGAAGAAHTGAPHAGGESLPLAAFEAPCLFRAAATGALDTAQIPWHTAFTSSSLTGLWAATAAGLGLTVRTPLGLPPTVRALTGAAAAGLPPLPSIRLALRMVSAPLPFAAAQLRDILLDSLTASLPARATRPLRRRHAGVAAG